MVDSLPAWTSNRFKRLALAPKRHVTDPGILAGALGVDAAAVLRDGDLLGRVLESFVAAHLRAEASYTTARARLHHLRAEQGRHEIDVVAEVGARDVLGIEVEAASAPSTNDARRLIWLRDELGARFLHGVVLRTGPRTFELSERIVAAPIGSIWGPG